MPVGTRGAIKYLSAADYEELGAEIVLGNTYHLMLRPGAETVAALRRARRVRRLARPHAHRLGRVPGVLARTEGRRRRGHVPFDLRRVDAPVHPGDRGADPGAARRRHPDGARRLPTAARRHSRWSALAVERTAAWAARARAAHRRDDQALFGIVQGGTDPSASRRERPAHRRVRSSTATGSAGCRSGRPEPRCSQALGADDAAPARRPAPLPDGRRRPGLARRGGRPRGRPVRLRDADPDRPARHRPHRRRQAPREGGSLRPRRRADRRRRAAARSVARHSRGYLRHLFQVGEPTASRLVSIHNLAWTLALMDRMRAAIAAGTFADAPHRGPRRSGRDRTRAHLRVANLVRRFSSSIDWSLMLSSPCSPAAPPTTRRAEAVLRSSSCSSCHRPAHVLLADPPAAQRMREAQALVASIGEGDEVITTGGIYGFVTAIDGDDRLARHRRRRRDPAPPLGDRPQDRPHHGTRRRAARPTPPEIRRATTPDADDATEK